MSIFYIDRRYNYVGTAAGAFNIFYTYDCTDITKYTKICTVIKTEKENRKDLEYM